MPLSLVSKQTSDEQIVSPEIPFTSPDPPCPGDCDGVSPALFFLGLPA